MERQIEELNRSLYAGSAEAVNLHGLARSLVAGMRVKRSADGASCCRR
jgi:hypothetical protein